MRNSLQKTRENRFSNYAKRQQSTQLEKDMETKILQHRGQNDRKQHGEKEAKHRKRDVDCPFLSTRRNFARSMEVYFSKRPATCPKKAEDDMKYLLRLMKRISKFTQVFLIWFSVFYYK